MYFLDVAKDVLFVLYLTVFTDFVPWDVNAFPFQVVGILVLSIIVPAIGNAHLLLSSDEVQGFSPKTKLALCCCVPLQPMVALYQATMHQARGLDHSYKMKQVFDRETKLGEIPNTSNMRLILQHKSSSRKWERLLADMKSLEMTLEHFPQLLVLAGFISIRFSSTNTVDGLQDAIAAGNKIFVVASLLWSMKVLVTTPLHLQVRQIMSKN